MNKLSDPFLRQLSDGVVFSKNNTPDNLKLTTLIYIESKEHFIF